MDFGLAFSYVFKDPEWVKKVALAALVSLIPIVGQFFLIGWAAEITHRVMVNDPTPLPNIEFSPFLVRGLKIFVVYLVYSIPMILFYLPIMIIALATQNAANGDTMQTVGIIVALVSICFGGLMMIYGVILGFLLPAAVGNFLAKGESIGAGLRFGEVFGLVKAAPVPYLLVLLGALIGGVIAPLGSIACGIGALLTATYSACISSHLTGQAYKQARPL